MPVDPRTPVLIGYGQVNQREESPTRENTLEPVDLMAAAARQAADARVLRAVDTVWVVKLFSARYRDPGRLLGQRIGADNPTTGYSSLGGNVPQSLVNQACLNIWHGRADVVLLAGGETWHTRTRLRANGDRLEWTHQDESVPLAEPIGADVPMTSEAEQRIRLDQPAYIYPLFEQAVRIAGGESIANHRRRIGELWARFNAVAVGNPHAWIRESVSAEEIWQVGPKNRMISWPYTKLLNANNMVDQAASLVLTSVATATDLGVPTERWVFPQAGTDAHDTYAVAERAELFRSPAIRVGGIRALELAGIDEIGGIDYVDLYSCFPSAVQVAAAELGLPTDDPDRPLTVTGGLTFAGGPWNNYVMHSIATLAELLVAHPGRRGLISANGGYLTKHSFGVYGTEPPRSGFRWEDVQAIVDREPTRPAAVQWQGRGSVESWTTPFDRDGRPEKVFVAVRTSDGSRTLALITDPGVAEFSVREDIAGAKVEVHADGTATLP